MIMILTSPTSQDSPAEQKTIDACIHTEIRRLIIVIDSHVETEKSYSILFISRRTRKVDGVLNISLKA